MEYKRFGSSGIFVSPMALGTQYFGTSIPKEEAFAIMDCALENGINLFDTANFYSTKYGKSGASEATIGEWLKLHPENRKKVYINTKSYYKLENGVYGNNDTDFFSYEKFILNCNESLERLNTDYIDIFTIHFEPQLGQEREVWDAYDTLRKQSKVMYAGSSNFSAYGLARMQEEARRRNTMGFVVQQNRYNLCRREVELEIMRAIKNENMAQIAWGPLYSGRLTSKVFNNSITFRNPLNDQMIEKLRKYHETCAKYGLKGEHVALAWVMSKGVIPITGAETVAELQNNLEAINLKLDENLVKEIEEIFPGYIPAPDAYMAM